MSRMLFRLLFLVLSASIAAADMLVIAPHPDDEVIGCAGVILQALEAQKRVTVVILTNGDGHVALTAVVAKKEREQLTAEDFMKACALRQGHSIAAMKRLGVPREDLLRQAKVEARLLAFVVLGDSLAREPDLRLTFSPQAYETKKAALNVHTKGTSPVHDGLVDESLKSEELFWQFAIP